MEDKLIDSTEASSSPSEGSHHADWPKMLEWIEKQAQESLKARFTTAEILAKEAQTTLTVLLAGVGASGAYATKIFESNPAGPIAIAFAIVCAYLASICVALVLICMKIKSYPALYQDPENLMHPTFSLDSVREQEVKNIGKRIAEAKALNDVRARWLNAFRVMAVCSPLVFIAAALAASH